MSTTEKMIDACTAYIERKGASYIAKEGIVVFYTSLSGRKKDMQWVKLSIPEVLRIIRAVSLSGAAARELQEYHLIAAFQEIGEVYEFATNNPSVKTTDEVFSYHQESGAAGLDEQVVTLVCDYIDVNFEAVLSQEVLEAVVDCSRMMDFIVPKSRSLELIQSKMDSLGYDYRQGSRRPLYRGTKRVAYMKPLAKPSGIRHIDIHHKLGISNRVKANMT